MKLRNKKSGEIIDFQPFRFYQRDNHKYPSDIFESLSALNEEWEDYKPKEPLIKDEKIRKAVRFCADIWESNKLLVIKSGSRIEFSDGSPNMRYASFMYAEWQDEIEDRTYYTIDELCGEEK